jgi:hypothetical protein
MTESKNVARARYTLEFKQEGICQNWVTFSESKDEEGKSQRPVCSLSVIKGSRRRFAGQQSYF